MEHSSCFQPPASALDSLLSQSSGGMRASSELPTTCCCGRPKCAYLEHNDAALRGLEQDLQSAAQIGQVSTSCYTCVLYLKKRACMPSAIGAWRKEMSLTFALQALLARHEAYMAEAEEERRKMGMTVDKLEGEKRGLEASNAKTIKENRYLLDQLEDLNKTISDADSQITSLNATLQSTMKELDRLTALAAQTSQLEKQLASLESEQHVLQREIMSKGDSEKSAIQRWKTAERTVNALQEQVERIEREAREERARHAEVVGRFERRRLVENELENAAGRLKGAAAAKGMGKEDGNSSVVSSFVNDILQDNANLQLGIMELRDMLMGSNEEVENLREQMILHQPMLPNTDEDANTDTSKPPFLDNELARTPTAEFLSDFHVHHHYHAAPKDETKRQLILRRPKKRRNIASPGMRTPSSGTQTPRTPTSNPMRHATSSTATILEQTSVTIPPASQASHAHNWSMSQAPSSAAPSSIPNSPVFDAMSDVPDSSRPTTPGSTNLGSPQFLPRHSKRGSDVSDYILSLGQNVPHSISSILHGNPQEEFDESYFPMLDHNTIPEEPEDDSVASRPSTKDTVEDYDPAQLKRPTLHRASSHESLLSACGLDLPKTYSKPSTHLLSGPRTSFSTSISSGVPITGATAATAHRSKGPPGFDSRSSYNNLLSMSGMSTSPPGMSDKPTLGNRVGSLGGWITGRWGIAPAPAPEGVTSPTSSVFSRTSAESREGKGISAQKTKNADINGKRFDELAARKRADNELSTHIEPVHLNDSLLQESLSEEAVPTSKTTAAVAVAESVKAIGGGEKLEVRKKGKAEKRLSTHVEAVTVDGAGLA